MKKKWPLVTVQVLDDGYDAKISVFRHVSTPDEISVNIHGIKPRPPAPLVDGADGVSKVVKGGGQTWSFNIEKTYPYEKG